MDGAFRRSKIKTRPRAIDLAAINMEHGGDAILPCQVGSPHQLSGEYRLLLAVLDDSLHVLQTAGAKVDPKQRAAYRDARAWVSDDTEGLVAPGAEVPYVTFTGICEALRVEPDEVRKELRRKGWL